MMRRVYKIFILLALVFGAAMHVQADSKRYRKRYKKALFWGQDDLSESVISPHHILVCGTMLSCPLILRPRSSCNRPTAVPPAIALLPVHHHKRLRFMSRIIVSM